MQDCRIAKNLEHGWIWEKHEGYSWKAVWRQVEDLDIIMTTIGSHRRLKQET